MADINVIDGDVLESNADIILHQVNCCGVMGSGVAKQVRNRYPKVFRSYRTLCESMGERRRDLLGMAHIVHIGGNRYIGNLFAQECFGRDKRHTEYDKLKECLDYVNKAFSNKTVAIPYLMGCDRGGGDWNIVSDMIKSSLKDCEVIFYRFKG